MKAIDNCETLLQFFPITESKPPNENALYVYDKYTT